MGDIDLVKVVLDELGDLEWMQIAIRPAKPFALGTVDRTPRRSGCPATPVSSMVSFEVLARPALRRLAGRPSTLPRPAHGQRWREDFGRAPGRQKLHLVRVAVERGRRRGASWRSSAGGQGIAPAHRPWRGPTRSPLLPDGEGAPSGRSAPRPPIRGP